MTSSFIHLIPHSVSNEDGLPILHFHRVRLDPLLDEVVGHLLGHFSQNFSRQPDRVRLQIPEWHKLDDISVPVFPQLIRIERGDISVKLLHLFKICITYANNND